MRIIYLTDSIGTKRGGGSGLSGKRFLDLLKSRYGQVHIVSDAVREPPTPGPGHSVTLIRRTPPRFGRSVSALVRYFGIRMINMLRPRHAVIDGKGEHILVICNSFIGYLDSLRIINSGSVRMACVVRGDVNSFHFQSFSPGTGTEDELQAPLAFLTRFDFHIYVSARIRDNWTQLLGSGHQAFWLPNAIDEQEVSALLSRPVESVRAELGMEPETFHVVVVGTIQKRKGQDIFAPAAEALFRALPNVRVHFIGGVSPRWGGTEMAQALESSGDGRYRIHGHREDALKFVRAADVAVLVSHSEAFPRTVAEYMALGKPIVTTPVAGSDEMIQHGETGLIIPIGDYGALVNALLAFAASSELSSRIGEAARQRYFLEYSAARQEQRFAEIFEQIDQQCLGDRLVHPATH